MVKSKKFVTGATGYIGRTLVDSLIKNGYEVYIFTRKESSIFLNNKKVTVIIGDITDPITLPSDIDTIYHCAGVIYQSNEEMEKVNVLGTQNIVNIAIKNNCKLIYLSSAGIAGNTKEKVITENTICNPQNTYELSKFKAEQIVINAIKDGLRVHILRPTTIFGFRKNTEKDSFFHLLKAMRNGSYKNIGNGVYNIVHINEVIRAMELLDESNVIYGGIYLINNPILYKEMDILVKYVQPIIFKKTQTIIYPIAFIITILLTFFYFITNKKNPLTFSRLGALTNKKIYSQDKIMKAISFKNTLPVEEYIKIVCKEYIDIKLLP